LKINHKNDRKEPFILSRILLGSMVGAAVAQVAIHLIPRVL
jgi:hypothetical protein